MSHKKSYLTVKWMLFGILGFYAILIYIARFYCMVEVFFYTVDGFYIWCDISNLRESYRALIAKNGLIQSMSRKGNYWDNAPMEIFFDSLKTEHAHHEVYEDLKMAKTNIFQWIEIYYNRERLHSSLGYLSPACFEAKTRVQGA